jgi:glycine/D-amino acid oxidase-like deaminating enzyme
VIVAVDGRLERVLPELEGRVRTARLQMLATEPTDEVQFPRAVYARYGYEYWQQLPDGRVVLGGFRDRGGDGEWTDVAEPAEPVQGMLEAHLRSRLGVSAAITHRWAGIVGYTESGLPISEEARPGVWAIGGYSGTGNVVGAICGRGAARAVLGLDDPDRELFR